MSDALKTQVGGDHYKRLAIQPTEYCQRNGLGFCEANVVKYVTRHHSKGGRKDIEKAIHYLEILLAMEYPDKAEQKPKWRMLEDSEAINDGDEFLASDDLWKPSQEVGDYFDPFTHNAHRRRVTPDLSELNQHITELLKHE